jgi:hypothetical protein
MYWGKLPKTSQTDWVVMTNRNKQLARCECCTGEVLSIKLRKPKS